MKVSFLNISGVITTTGTKNNKWAFAD